MEPIKFLVENDIIRGTVHLPSETNQLVPGVLIIPGFADTAVGPHNLHVQMARFLCNEGFAVLRFDYRGQGESDGSFTDFTIQKGLQDARAGLQFLTKLKQIDCDKLGIVGFSLGGLLASQLAAETETVKVLSLLAPVAYPVKVFRAFFNQSHLEEAEKYGWCDWLGWPVGKRFLDGLGDFDPLEAIKHVKAKTILFQGTKDTEVPCENAEAFSRAGVTTKWVEGCDHQFSSICFQDSIIRLTGKWFSEHLLE